MCTTRGATIGIGSCRHVSQKGWPRTKGEQCAKVCERACGWSYKAGHECNIILKNMDWGVTQTWVQILSLTLGNWLLLTGNTYESLMMCQALPKCFTCINSFKVTMIYEVCTIVICILRIKKKMEAHRGYLLGSVHTAKMWQRMDLNPDTLLQNFVVWITRFTFIVRAMRSWETTTFGCLAVLFSPFIYYLM